MEILNIPGMYEFMYVCMYVRLGGHDYRNYQAK